MAGTNLFDDLKKALSDFKSFLDTNTPVIKPAVSALKGLGVPIDDLINQLVTLLGELKTGIQNLNTNQIPGLDKVSEFATGVTAVLDAAKALLPDEAAEIEQVAGIASVVTSLPALDQVKAEILTLIDDIVTNLNSLKA